MIYDIFSFRSELVCMGCVFFSQWDAPLLLIALLSYTSLSVFLHETRVAKVAKLRCIASAIRAL